MYCCASSQSLYPNGELKDFVPAMLDLHTIEIKKNEKLTKVKSKNDKVEVVDDNATNIPMVLQHDDGKPCRKPCATPAPAEKFLVSEYGY